MASVWELLVKTLAGGLLVVAFALVGEVVQPKRFAGLFGAAPAVALAGLTVAVIFKGRQSAQREAIGMIVGAGAMIVYCFGVVVSIRRLGALRASLVALVVWAFLAAGLYVAVFE
ncbi:MAG TPA: DUF3147 family protein [Gaiellaceae bacterium]